MHFRSGNSFASWTASATSTKRDDTTPSVMVLEKTRPALDIHLPPAGLPPPVSFPSDASSPGRRSRHKKNARVSAGLRVHWDRFVRKLGSGTAPSSSSNFDDSVGESSGYPRSRIGGVGALAEVQLPVDDRVDEVVVDREWSDEIKSSSVTHSDHGGSPDKSGSNHLGGTNTDRDSFAIRPEGFWGSCRLLIFLRWRLWPASYGFFSTKFLDEKSEMHYNKENWFLRKVSFRLCFGWVERSYVPIALGGAAVRRKCGERSNAMTPRMSLLAFAITSTCQTGMGFALCCPMKLYTTGRVRHAHIAHIPFRLY